MYSVAIHHADKQEFTDFKNLDEGVRCALKAVRKQCADIIKELSTPEEPMVLHHVEEKTNRWLRPKIDIKLVYKGDDLRSAEFQFSNFRSQLLINKERPSSGGVEMALHGTMAREALASRIRDVRLHRREKKVEEVPVSPQLPGEVIIDMEFG